MTKDSFGKKKKERDTRRVYLTSEYTVHDRL